LPSFLIFVVPLTLFNYQDALVIFDCVQLLLLPLIVYFLFRLNWEKSLLAVSLLVVVAVLQPSPTPHWGLSVSYFWQWEEGQDKVLNTALLLGSFYFGQSRKPVLSGFAMALGSFDPRFLLLALPLFLYYNRTSLKKGVASLLVCFLLLNSLSLVPGVGSGFLAMVTRSGLETPLFYYGYIPFLTLLSLIIVNAKELYHFFTSPLLAKASHTPASGKTREK
jgi:hypothetical protein